MKAIRWIPIGVAAAVIAVVAVAVVYDPGEGTSDPPNFPEVVEGVEPAAGDLVPRQTLIEIDLKTGYQMELWVLANPAAGVWQRIPDRELRYIEGTGVYSWVPGPGMTIEEWASGNHTLRIVWDTVTGLPDVGEYEWTFRTY